MLIYLLLDVEDDLAVPLEATGDGVADGRGGRRLPGGGVRQGQARVPARVVAAGEKLLELPLQRGPPPQRLHLPELRTVHHLARTI